MGLDMYLERVPLKRGMVGGRKRTLTPQNFNAICNWISYNKYLEMPLREDETEKCKWENWSNGYKYLPDTETLEELYFNENITYADWDKEQLFPNTPLIEQVGYWRKANAIHKWLVDRVQSGVDDCDYHNPLSKTDIEDLRDICQEVLDSLDLQPTKDKYGYDVLLATNTELAETLLPTEDGYYFGDTQYDEYYASNLEDTIEICNKVLETTDFNNQQLYYCSSW